MMRGENVPPDSHLIEPVCVVPRRSTPASAVEDEEVSQAMSFIRKHVHQGINVDDVLTQVGLSRSILNRRFQAVVGHTLHEEIARQQMEKVKQLLIDTDLPLAEIAERCGFKHVEYMSVVVKKKTGMPPSEYRKRHRSR